MHTVFLEGVPVLDLSALNQVRRLIVLVDTLYEHKIRLVVLAAAPPTGVFPAGTTAVASSDAEAEAAGEFGLAGNLGDLIGDATYLQKNVDEVFAFDRTVSRLLEMQSRCAANS